MIGVVICTHGDLAEHLLASACMIVGDFPGANTVAVHPGDGPDEIRARLEKAIGEVDAGDGVLLLCDMFGGTPSNLCLSLLGDDREVVTGVNLPMLLKLWTTRTGDLGEVARSVAHHTRDNILVAGDLLRRGS